MMILVMMMMINEDDHKIRINKHLWVAILQGIHVVAIISRAEAVNVLYNTSYFNLYFAKVSHIMLAIS